MGTYRQPPSPGDHPLHAKKNFLLKRRPPPTGVLGGVRQPKITKILALVSGRGDRHRLRKVMYGPIHFIDLVVLVGGSISRIFTGPTWQHAHDLGGGRSSTPVPGGHREAFLKMYGEIDLVFWKNFVSQNDPRPRTPPLSTSEKS